MEIKQAIEKEDFLKCWEVVHELRPQLDQEKYLTLILYMLDEGYRLIYIDDLCTLPEARGKGHGKALLKYVREHAEKEELQSVHLDSGHHRHNAHRLYLNFGFKITSHHFAMDL